MIVAVDGHSIAGEPADAATARIKGPPGSEVTLVRRLERRQAPQAAASSGRRSRCRSRRASCGTPAANKVGYVQLAGFSEGAHGELRGEVEKLYGRGAQGLVLDLRGNGGGLLNEAVLTSSIFIEDGIIVSTDGRTQPQTDYEAVGGALDPEPMVVLIDRNTASAAEILASALADHGLATLVGTRSYGKGIFQEVIELDHGGALDLTVGEYLTADGVSLAGKGIEPDVHVRDRRSTPGDEALHKALDVLAGELDSDRDEPGRRASAAGSDFVAVVGRRGRALVAEPLFEPGPQVAAARRQAGQRRRDGARRAAPRRGPRRRDAGVAAARGRRRRGAARGPRSGARLQRPRRGRGAARRSPIRPVTAAGARTSRAWRPSRSTRRPRATSTMRCPRSGGRRAAAVDPHRRRRRPRAARHRARGRGPRARHEHLRPGHGRADAAAGAERGGLQPVAGRRAARRHDRDRARARRRRALDRVLPQPDPLRRPAQLRTARRDLRRALAARPTRSPSRSRWRAAPPAVLAERAPHRLARGRVVRARVRVRRVRRGRQRPLGPADRGPQADRAPDDPDQRARRRAAGAAQGADALPRPRAARPGADRAPRRAARGARDPDPAAAGQDLPERGRRAGQRGEPARRRRGAAARPRRRRLRVARAALAQAGLLQPSQPRPRRPRQPRLCSLHLADSPLPRPRRPPGPARSGREARTTADASEVRDAGPHSSTRERDATRIERDADDVCAAFLLDRELSASGWERGFEGEVSGLVGGGAFIRFAGELGPTSTRASCRRA